MLPSCALEMLNGHRKWREKAGNDAENGIFIIKAIFSGFFMFFKNLRFYSILYDMKGVGNQV